MKQRSVIECYVLSCETSAIKIYANLCEVYHDETIAVKMFGSGYDSNKGTTPYETSLGQEEL